MNTLEIDTLLKKHPQSRPVFNGVYTRNRLYRLLSVPSALVGSTDPDHRMGQHWIAIYIDANSRGKYYDPTGRTLHESTYVNFMNKHCLHWTYNTVRVREEGSSVCELHCIFYLIHHVQDIAWQTSPGCYKNPVEATGIVQKFVLLLVKPVLWKKKKERKSRYMQPLYKASLKPG
jgi:hypothetical protein